MEALKTGQPISIEGEDLYLDGSEWAANEEGSGVMKGSFGLKEEGAPGVSTEKG